MCDIVFRQLLVKRSPVKFVIWFVMLLTIVTALSVGCDYLSVGCVWVTVLSVGCDYMDLSLGCVCVTVLSVGCDYMDLSLGCVWVTALSVGCSDYMDRFLDEQENPVPLRDRSSSPSVNSLIYADPKRQPPADASSPRAASPCKLAPQQPRTPTLHASLAGFRPISDALSCTVASRASPANSAPSSDAEHSEPSAKRLKTEPALARHTCPAPALPVEGAAGPTAFTRLTNYGDCVGSVALSLASINSSVKILGDAAIGPIASPATLAVTESVVR